MFAGLAIVLFAWWADHHLLNLLDWVGAYPIYDVANFVLDYSIATVVGGAIALWGAYRYLTAPPT